MGKGEIARYKQFLLFPQCFQKACFPGASKGVIVWEWVKEKTYKRMPAPIAYHTSTDFCDPTIDNYLNETREFFKKKKQLYVLFQ